MRFLITLSLVLTFFLTGCSRTDNPMGSDTGQNRSGTEMDMSGNMMDHMKQCQGMMTQHLGKADAQYDKRFIDMMVQHHEGAIDMAKDALQKAQHPEIKQLAQNVIDAQEKEINQLKAWRKEWYGSTAQSP